MTWAQVPAYSPMEARMTSEPDNGSPTPLSASSPGPVREELSQAKARLGVCLFALVYVAGWTVLSGPVTGSIVGALIVYTVFSTAWIMLVRARPGEVAWRRWVVIFGDLGINTFFMHSLQAKGAFFYPMYLWIIVGNGMRYGPRYLVLAMIVGVAYFGPMLVWSSYWRANAVAGSGLLAGLVVLPMFYLSLIKNLHRANARLTLEVERSQAAVRSKTEFLANMSHELRTPMSGVIGISELMRQTPLSKIQAEYLDLIQRSAHALLSVIDDVLELSRIEAGKVTLACKPFDFRAIVDDVCHLLRPAADDKGVSMELSFAPQAPRDFIGDPSRIRQILVNLLGNAVKFTGQGSISVDYRCEPLSEMKVQISLRIVDTGIGIPEDKLEHIFEKFEQAESRLSRRFGGSGLGLAISRHLARMMDGDVTVSSELGRGTTFILRLVLPPSFEPPAEDTQNDDVPALDFGWKALVVEDNPVNRLVTCGYLKHLGVSTVTVEDGESALEQVQQEPFDLVIMDVQLPDLDGLETTRRIRAGESAGQHLPIVALTANAFSEDRDACLQAGMDVHLRKPLRLADLASALANLQEQVSEMATTTAEKE